MLSSASDIESPLLLESTSQFFIKNNYIKLVTIVQPLILNHGTVKGKSNFVKKKKKKKKEKKKRKEKRKENSTSN